jgi:hypothetical protein
MFDQEDFSLFRSLVNTPEPDPMFNYHEHKAWWWDLLKVYEKLFLKIDPGLWEEAKTNLQGHLDEAIYKKLVFLSYSKRAYADPSWNLIPHRESCDRIKNLINCEAYYRIIIGKTNAYKFQTSHVDFDLQLPKLWAALRNKNVTWEFKCAEFMEDFNIKQIFQDSAEWVAKGMVPWREEPVFASHNNIGFLDRGKNNMDFVSVWPDRSFFDEIPNTKAYGKDYLLSDRGNNWASLYESLERNPPDHPYHPANSILTLEEVASQARFRTLLYDHKGFVTHLREELFYERVPEDYDGDGHLYLDCWE